MHIILILLKFSLISHSVGTIHLWQSLNSIYYQFEYSHATKTLLNSRLDTNAGIIHSQIHEDNHEHKDGFNHFHSINHVQTNNQKHCFSLFTLYSLITHSFGISFSCRIAMIKCKVTRMAGFSTSINRSLIDSIKLSWFIPWISHDLFPKSLIPFEVN